MTSLPSGLASISARLDDAPNARGAVAFGRMVRENAKLQRAVDEHARLAAGDQGMTRAEAVARSMWAARVRQAAMQGITLEPWGDGSIPKASGIMEEAEAALLTVHNLVLGSAYRSADRR